MPGGPSFGSMRASAALYEPLRRLPQITRTSRFPSFTMEAPHPVSILRLVMHGLDPRIHHGIESCKLMDCRVKPGNDEQRASGLGAVAFDEGGKSLQLLLDEPARRLVLQLA